MTDETPETPGPVGIVVVSHSSELADATVRLVARLANLPADGPRLIAAGGLADGSIGTDATRIADALAEADTGAGVVVLADLGSAVLATATAVEELVGTDLASRVRISGGPLVEGAFVAAVQASAGDRLDGVLVAADGAASMNKLEGR
jgi:dihydroxyacetone kinase phosphotransfer subunit